MAVRVYESTGHVDAPRDLYVSSDVRAVFGRHDGGPSVIAYPPGRTLALWFVSASTGERVPVPEDVSVTQGNIPMEPWSSGEFVLLVDRVYQVRRKGYDEPIFETQAAVRETQVGLTRSASSFAPHVERMTLFSAA